MHSYVVFDNWLCCVVFSDIHGTNYELNPYVNSNTKLNIISLLNYQNIENHALIFAENPSPMVVKAIVFYCSQEARSIS